MDWIREYRSEEKFIRKNSGKTFKARKHDKAEKRKQGKKSLMKKCQRQRQQENPVQQQKVLCMKNQWSREIVKFTTKTREKSKKASQVVKTTEEKECAQSNKGRRSHQVGRTTHDENSQL